MVCAALLLTALPCSQALAGDGVYGRLAGDLEISASAGAALTGDAPAFVARAAALYVATVGTYLGYADAFGQSDASVDRSIAFGLTLKPMFWARFANDLQTGVGHLDLFIDSFAFELGAFWAAPHGRAIEQIPGLELALGLAVPILAEATGPYLEVRGALRYRRSDLLDGTSADPFERGAMLSVSLSWHHVLPAHIADAGDRLTR